MIELEQPLEHEIDPGLQAELAKHPGQWAAITRSELIAMGDDPMTVYNEAIAAGVDAPIIYRIPEDSRTSYFLVGRAESRGDARAGRHLSSHPHHQRRSQRSGHQRSGRC